MKKVYLIAVVFALIAGLATYMFASNLNKKTTIKDRETVKVVVALKDIPKNTLVDESMLAEDAGYFQIKSFIKEDAAPEYISKLDDIKEQVTYIDIYAGEQLNTYKFVGADSKDVGLSFKLAEGKKAYAFPADSTNGVDGFISPGDTVDVLTYETDNKGEVKAKIAYKDLKVIKVSNNAADEKAQTNDSKITSYSSITVEVTEKQAIKLAEIEHSKSYKLLLNSKRDGGAVDNEVENNNANADAQQQEETQQDAQA